MIPETGFPDFFLESKNAKEYYCTKLVETDVHSHTRNKVIFTFATFEETGLTI